MINILKYTFMILGLLLLCSYSRASQPQVTCLAKAMYFEARGGQDKDLINIGNVVLNRTNHKEFPKTVCNVISDRKHAIQFPWYYQKKLVVRDFSTYRKIEEMANKLYNAEKNGNRVDTTKGAVFFHAKSISTGWRYIRVSVNDSLHNYYKT